MKDDFDNIDGLIITKEGIRSRAIIMIEYEEIEYDIIDKLFGISPEEYHRRWLNRKTIKR